MNNPIVTGHSADVAATSGEADQIKAEWDAMTEAEREAYKAESRAKFDADCAAIGHTPFWS